MYKILIYLNIIGLHHSISGRYWNSVLIKVVKSSSIICFWQFFKLLIFHYAKSFVHPILISQRCVFRHDFRTRVWVHDDIHGIIKCFFVNFLKSLFEYSIFKCFVAHVPMTVSFHVNCLQMIFYCSLCFFSYFCSRCFFSSRNLFLTIL